MYPHTFQEFNKKFTTITFKNFQDRYAMKAESIGKGSGSIVSLATDKKCNNRNVAIKEYSKHQLKNGAHIDIQRQIDNYRRIATFHSKHYFVQLYDALRVVDLTNDIEKTNFYCIVLEYCQCSLEDLMKKKDQILKIPLQTRLEICLSITEGIQVLHKNGIIHRDLKPGNILLAQRGGKVVPLLADFGLTREIEAMMTSFRGTPKYADPILYGKQNYGFQWDIYSLGLIILQIVSGQFLFKSYQNLPSREYLRMVHSLLKNLNSVLNTIQAEDQFKFIVEKCITMNPRERFSSTQIADHLRNYISLKFSKSRNKIFQSKYTKDTTFTSQEQSHEQSDPYRLSVINRKSFRSSSSLNQISRKFSSAIQEADKQIEINMYRKSIFKKPILKIVPQFKFQAKIYDSKINEQMGAKARNEAALQSIQSDRKLANQEKKQIKFNQIQEKGKKTQDKQKSPKSKINEAQNTNDPQIQSKKKKKSFFGRLCCCFHSG